VETVGDKYMAVSGLPEPCEDHVRCIARLALDMMDLSQTVVVDGVPVVSARTARATDRRLSYDPVSAAHNHRHPQRRGGDWSDRTPDAPVLFVRQHREPDQPHGDHRRAGQNQRLGKRVQVRSVPPPQFPKLGIGDERKERRVLETDGFFCRQTGRFSTGPVSRTSVDSTISSTRPRPVPFVSA